MPLRSPPPPTDDQSRPLCQRGPPEEAVGTVSVLRKGSFKRKDLNEVEVRVRVRALCLCVI